MAGVTYASTLIRVSGYAASRTSRLIRSADARVARIEIVRSLQVHPELRCHVKVARQAQGGISRDAAAAVYDLAHPVVSSTCCGQPLDDANLNVWTSSGGSD
jgi:hypothetical protein